MRRTKEDAARTRAAIVDAALDCFDRHGIAGSTLDQIAAAAGVTKGAIYHHFRGKRELFHEIREQVTLPLLDDADTGMLRGTGAPALERVEAFLLGTLRMLQGDRRTRCALTVMQFKCEYVDDLAGELAGGLRANRRLVKAFEAAYREARAAGQMRADLEPEWCALETALFLSGLVRLWILHGARSRLRAHADELVRSHVRTRRRDQNR